MVNLNGEDAMRNITVPVGVFSEGTLLGEDVGSAIADLLRPLRLLRKDRALVREWDKHMSGDPEERRGVDTADLCDDLWDALNNYLPPYCYAGSSEGDGACFGVWPITDSDDLPRYAAGDEPSDDRDCYSITDHGNVACGRRTKRGKWIEYWSVV